MARKKSVNRNVVHSAVGNSRGSVARKKSVNVADLPNYQHAQINEALEEEVTFSMPNGKKFTFRPQVEWSFRCEQAIAEGDVVTWARGALKNPDQLDDFLELPSRDIGRVLQYFVDVSEVSREKGGNSSGS